MSSVAADKLRQLLSAMDVGDANAAANAMREASKLLRTHGLSFQKFVEQIEGRHLLLPQRIATAIKMMDSATAQEAESAFGSVRKMMKACGLTFAQMTEALEHEPVDRAELVSLQAELQAETDRVKRLQKEVTVLRATFGITRGVLGMSRFRSLGHSLLVNGFFVVLVAGALTWVLVQLHATIFPASVQAAQIVEPVYVAPPVPQVSAPPASPVVLAPSSSSPVPRNRVDQDEVYLRRGSVVECWRDGSIRSWCFIK